MSKIFHNSEMFKNYIHLTTNKENGFNVLLNWDDFTVESSDESVVKKFKYNYDDYSYFVYGVYGKSGSADVTLKYNNPAELSAILDLLEQR